jgi:hypothetical protein
MYNFTWRQVEGIVYAYTTLLKRYYKSKPAYLGKAFMVTNIRQLIEEKLRNYPYLILENNILYNTGRNYRVTRSCMYDKLFRCSQFGTVVDF